MTTTTEKLPQRRVSIYPLIHRFGGNTESLAAAANVSVRQVQRWMSDGVSFDKADKIATAAEETPSVVWPDWEWDDPKEGDAEAVTDTKAGITLDAHRKPLAWHLAAQPLTDDLTRLTIWLTKKWAGLDVEPLPRDLDELHAKILKANVEHDDDGQPVADESWTVVRAHRGFQTSSGKIRTKSTTPR